MAPNPEDWVIFIKYLKNKEKDDINTFLINDNTKISTKKAFLEHNPNSNDKDATNSNNINWADFYLENT